MMFMFSLPTFAICRGLTECIEPGQALVTGNVTFLAQKRNYPPDIKDIYKGRSSSMNFSKQGKSIKVYGTYDGAPRLLLTEEGKFLSHEGRYDFFLDIPELINVYTETLTKETFNSGLFLASFYNLLNEDNDNDGESSVNSIITNLPINISKSMSVTKLIVSRKGNKGSMKGFFKASDSAKGRFSLKFQFK